MFDVSVTSATQVCDTCTHYSCKSISKNPMEDVVDCAKEDELLEYEKRGFDTSDFGDTIDCPIWKSGKEIAVDIKSQNKSLHYVNTINEYVSEVTGNSSDIETSVIVNAEIKVAESQVGQFAYEVQKLINKYRIKEV